MVEIGHKAVYGRQPSYPIAMDVGALAQGLGADFLRVTRPGDLTRAAERLLRPDGPIVVDVQIDPSVKLPRKDRMAELKAAARTLRLVN